MWNDLHQPLFILKRPSIPLRCCDTAQSEHLRNPEIGQGLGNFEFIFLHWNKIKKKGSSQRNFPCFILFMDQASLFMDEVLFVIPTPEHHELKIKAQKCRSHGPQIPHGVRTHHLWDPARATLGPPAPASSKLPMMCVGGKSRTPKHYWTERMS